MAVDDNGFFCCRLALKSDQSVHWPKMPLCSFPQLLLQQLSSQQQAQRGATKVDIYIFIDKTLMVSTFESGTSHGHAPQTLVVPHKIWSRRTNPHKKIAGRRGKKKSSPRSFPPARKARTTGRWVSTSPLFHFCDFFALLFSVSFTLTNFFTTNHHPTTTSHTQRHGKDTTSFRRSTTTAIMSHESVWNSRPRKYGKGARSWYELPQKKTQTRESQWKTEAQRRGGT